MNSKSTTFDLLLADTTRQKNQSSVTRSELLEFWHDRFGIPPKIFKEYTFWEKGYGKIWVFRGNLSKSTQIEALGLRFTTTNQKNWKPTTNAVQKFGHHAHKNVLSLPLAQVLQFVQGAPLHMDWDGTSGYVIVRGNLSNHDIQIGVGLYSNGTLHSQIPKSRQLHLS
jgi:NOL1/NOP2/fmu family ribosome biogenesis protein